jgi:hypothetical protein
MNREPCMFVPFEKRLYVDPHDSPAAILHEMVVFQRPDYGGQIFRMPPAVGEREIPTVMAGYGLRYLRMPAAQPDVVLPIHQGRTVLAHAHHAGGGTTPVGVEGVPVEPHKTTFVMLGEPSPQMSPKLRVLCGFATTRDVGADSLFALKDKCPDGVAITTVEIPAQK